MTPRTRRHSAVSETVQPVEKGRASRRVTGETAFPVASVPDPEPADARTAEAPPTRRADRDLLERLGALRRTIPSGISAAFSGAIVGPLSWDGAAPAGGDVNREVVDTAYS